MAAQGLNNRYGEETQHDPRRQVDIEGLIMRRAQSMHEEGHRASDLQAIPDDQWANMHPGGMIPDKKLVASHMRAYENYAVDKT